MTTQPLLEVKGLKKYFPVNDGMLPWRASNWVRAVDGIDFQIYPGETLGVIGESGCGKTTTAKLVLLQEPPTEGEINFEGMDATKLRGSDLKTYRGSVQVVFQDPFSSLSPRMRIRDDLSRSAVNDRVGEVMRLVGLQPDMATLFPHEFSGGQRQRIAIARSLATETRLIVLDEPVSGLDVSIRAQIINLLEELQAELGVSYLFIGHDLATVAHMSHRIAVMYLGKIVELAESQELCENPQHPYTRALFAAALPSSPDEEQEEETIAGEVPSALNIPPGCRFNPRCPYVMRHCSEAEPELKEVSPDHFVSCYLY